MEECPTSLNQHPMQCLVIDDEPVAREGIIDYINQLNFLKVSGSCASAIEATGYLQNADIDLLFLDINMPCLSGLDFLESLEHPPLTIFTTAYSEYALEGFRLQVVDYLLKPIAFKRFYQAALKAQQMYQSRKLTQNAANEIPNPFLYVRQGDAFLKITWEHILYIEGMQNYTKLHLKTESLVIHQTMTSLEETLPKGSFFRIHKSFLVNIYHIDSISGGRVFVGGHELPVSRHRKEELLQTVVYKNLISR